MMIWLFTGKLKKTETEKTGEKLTEREYLAIGICSGFLIMLYLFAMVVFLLIRRRHQRDKRLREEFLNLPLPQGLGHKSSKILGLEDSFNPYFGSSGNNKMRLSSRSSTHCSIHSRQDQEHIYDITKVNHFVKSNNLSLNITGLHHQAAKISG